MTWTGENQRVLNTLWFLLLLNQTQKGCKNDKIHVHIQQLIICHFWQVIGTTQTRPGIVKETVILNYRPRLFMQNLETT